MKKFYLILLVLFFISVRSQTEKIKIKKDTKENKHFVTLDGKQKGEISLTKLCSTRKVIINNNAEGLKIHHMVAVLKYSDLLVEYANHSDSIIDKVVFYMLEKKEKGSFKLYLQDITAFRKDSTKVVFNHIELLVRPD